MQDVYKRQEYICQYILALQAEGFPVKRMSIQNEANAVQKWDSCLYSAEEEREFLKTALYPALKKHGLDKIEIYIWDHNKERLYERAVETIDSETEKMITGMAFHWYSGDHFEEMELVRKRFPGLKLILSESCLEYCKFRSDDVTAVSYTHLDVYKRQCNNRMLLSTGQESCKFL